MSKPFTPKLVLTTCAKVRLKFTAVQKLGRGAFAYPDAQLRIHIHAYY